MADFPDFVRNPANRIAPSSQFTDDIEGYVFDGADQSQVALWRSNSTRTSREHAHEFDEYMFVLEGACTAVVDGERIELVAGQELHIRAGARQTITVSAGTRTLHVFGGKRVRRVG